MRKLAVMLMGLSAALWAEGAVADAKDLEIFHKTDSVDDAFEYLTSKLEKLYLSPKGLEQVKLT